MDEGQDRARAPRELTPLQRRLGAARLADRSSSEKRLALQAGYAESTANCPAKNGLRSFDFAAKIARAERLHDLEPEAVAALREVIRDKSEPGSTRAAASAATLKLIHDLGPDQAEYDENVALGELLHRARLRRAVLVGVRMAQRYEPDRLGAYVERIQSELAALQAHIQAHRSAEPKGKRRQQYPGPAPGTLAAMRRETEGGADGD